MHRIAWWVYSGWIVKRSKDKSAAYKLFLIFHRTRLDVLTGRGGSLWLGATHAVTVRELQEEIPSTPKGLQRSSLSLPT